MLGCARVYVEDGSRSEVGDALRAEILKAFGRPFVQAIVVENLLLLNDAWVTAPQTLSFSLYNFPSQPSWLIRPEVVM
jgi:hypothetical protein